MGECEQEPNWNEEINVLRCRYYSGRMKELKYKIEKTPKDSPYRRILAMDLQDCARLYRYYRSKFNRINFKRWLHG